ncbi:MAG: hydrogenase iron-sulfur subunit [Theionarchaea archaeon]|nr:hydrogenase iron-sulfur subunit [Theionarchaea archaeon]
MYEPKIIGFLCNWCSYAAADLAGTSRIQYPTNLRAIRVMCSSRIDPEHVLRAFTHGMDGVLIAGCHPGDCHYISGNYKTKRKYLLLQKMLEQFGIDPSRLRLEWCSSAEGGKFAQVVTEMTEDLRKLGPIKISEGD